MPEAPVHPFSDERHPPTRPEIDHLLGVLPAIELKRFERGLELLEPRINWSMEWYETERAWGYRASYRSRVVCILHFHHGFFTATFSIPLAREEEFLSVRHITPEIRALFREGFKSSPKAKWITVRIWRRREVESLLSLIERKLDDLRKKTS